MKEADGGAPCAGLLTDRVVSWLGCSDGEVDELQRLLNNGDTCNPVSPGVLVVHDYFGSGTNVPIVATQGTTLTAEASAQDRPPAEPPPWTSASSQTVWDRLGAGLNSILNFMGAPSICAWRDRSTSPAAPRRPFSERSRTRMDASDEAMWEAVSGAYVGMGARNALRDANQTRIAAREAVPETSCQASEPAIERILEAMRQEVHMMACSGCDQRIVGRRLKCTICDVFSLCEACIARPMHWPDAPLKAHITAHPQHRFTFVALPPLRCPNRHEVVPGHVEEVQWRTCESCHGQLKNGFLPAGCGPQFRCKEPTCRFGLCKNCYWTKRWKQSEHNELHLQESSLSNHDGFTELTPSRLASCKAQMCQPRCHLLFSSPLCVGHTVRVRLEGGRHWQDPAAVMEAWGAEFFAGYPSVVRSVRPGGLLAHWNSQQRAVQNVVRQGDMLMQVSVAGVACPLRGGSPIAALGRITLELRKDSVHGEEFNDDVKSMDLLFSGMRSLPRLHVENEIGALQGTGCEFIPRAATTENIRELIAAGECCLLHFSFHTSSDHSQRIFLEDVHGKAHVVTVEEFKRLLVSEQQRCQEHIRLVFISSCHSFALGKQIAEAGIRHVVCVRNEDSVMDSSCQIFERHFFTAVGAGRSVRQAFSCGMAALSSSPQQRIQDDGLKFALLPEDADHDEVLTAWEIPSSRLHSDLDRSMWGLVPAPVEDFVGREVDVHRLLLLLKDGICQRRFVLLHGEAGVGKTALMSEVGRFVNLRRDLFDEVRWLAPLGLDRDKVLAEYEDGLKCLRGSLSILPQRRVLLLVDDPTLVFWMPLRQLLTFPAVHVVFAVTSTAAMIPDLTSEALAIGTKPVRFCLGPLEPLDQARLFIGRAARELYDSEVFGKAKITDHSTSEVWKAERPSDYLALAESPLMQPLGGNARSIVASAQALGPAPFPKTRVLQRSVLNLEDESKVSFGAACGNKSKACAALLRTTDDGMLNSTREKPEVFVGGCRVPPMISLAHLP